HPAPPLLPTRRSSDLDCWMRSEICSCMSGPPSSPTPCSSQDSTERLRQDESSLKFRIISPPRIQRLSRWVMRVLRERPESSRCRRKGLRCASSNCFPGAISRGSTDQLSGQRSISGQYLVKRCSSDATMPAVFNSLVHRPMLLTRVLNACHHFPGFVYERARLRQELSTIEVQVRPRRGSKARCSSCQRPAPGYDRLPERRFEFIPLWGFAVVLLYAMRRVDCRHCGVKVEQVPWARGKHTLTDAYMLFLAHWARKLSWKETARAFHTSWDKV